MRVWVRIWLLFSECRDAEAALLSFAGPAVQAELLHEASHVQTRRKRQGYRGQALKTAVEIRKWLFWCCRQAAVVRGKRGVAVELGLELQGKRSDPFHVT